MTEIQESRLGPKRATVELRIAHRTKQDRVGFLAEGHGFRRKRITGGIYGSASDGRLLEVEIVAADAGDLLQNPSALGQHFRPYSVAG